MRSTLFVAMVCIALSSSSEAQDIALADATVYVTPDSPAQVHTTILIKAGKIAAVGRDVRVSPGVQTLACNGCVIFAGFWNVHVHFIGAQWAGADKLPATQLSRDMRLMLTHSGFTTVVDTASDRENTLILRRRIESGEVTGPRIYTAGFALYPPHGLPFYLDDLPEKLRARLPQPATPNAAVEAVRQNEEHGTDIVKLFTGSYLSPNNITHMPLDIAKAAVSEGHRHGQLLFAHPSDLEGVQIAIQSGVDVLAHAPDTVEGVDETLIKNLVALHMAMIPTLKLFSGSGHIDRIREIVAQFYGAGGLLLFGTDTGFLTDYDVTEEYHQLALAGLTFRDVIAMLTTNPAAKFTVASHAGLIKIGYDGDLTILGADPSTGDLRNFALVRYTIRAGKLIFDSASQQ